MCCMHSFAYGLLQLHTVCVNACMGVFVCACKHISNRRYEDRWLRCTMLEHGSCRRIAFARRVCVLLWVCSSLRVCAVTVCFSLQQPGLVLRPLMVREEPADGEPGLTWEHPIHYPREEAICVWFFHSNSQSDCLLLLLPNQRHLNIPLGALYCVLWVCV